MRNGAGPRGGISYHTRYSRHWKVKGFSVFALAAATRTDYGAAPTAPIPQPTLLLTLLRSLRLTLRLPPPPVPPGVAIECVAPSAVVASSAL